MKLVDSHCHLEAPEFSGNLETIITDAENAGVVKLITSSVTWDEWPLSKSISDKFRSVEFSIGVHPWYVSEKDLDIRNKLEASSGNGAIAVGEIGLDRKIEFPPFELQQKIFEEQMKFAVDANLPVIIHCRGAFNELIESVNRTGVPDHGGIIHAFSGSSEIAEILIRKGFSFSIGGTLTYKLSRKRSEVMKLIYPNHFLLETDSPDIPPAGTEKPNVPANILLNLKAASQITGRPEEEIAENTTENANRIFGLDI